MNQATCERLTESGSAVAHWPRLPVSVTQAVFERFQRLIYDETGIWLSNAKKALLCGRLGRRLRALQVDTLADYLELVIQPDQNSERMLMIDAITTNETHFFREPKHFEFLEQEMIPRWRAEAERRLRSNRIRIWSAGCSSGEEPYSLAMLLASRLPANEGWDVRILASDISTRVLAKAREGIYSIARAQDIPKHLLHQFMLKGIATQNGRMKVANEIQQMVRFARINLNQGPYAFDGPFDLVFCRNVLIYFDHSSKLRAVDTLVKPLSGNGFLLIGHAENLNGISSSVRSLVPTIYCKTESYARLASGFRTNRHGRP